ncbi:MAG TPA: DUF92 domain-containing protein [Terracidiphilus sp.]|nr:DUF92 domain-containing protein [Terracidiphilus sp.]
MSRTQLRWQSKTVLLVVFPAVGAQLVLETERWAQDAWAVAVCTLGVSSLLGLIAWRLRSASASGGWAGAAIAASLMFSTVANLCLPWRTALMPVLAVLVLTSIATRIGRKRKESLGTAEERTGRVAAQVAANLGAAALVAMTPVRLWMADTGWLRPDAWGLGLLYVPMLAALCEAAADTVSSELGQVLNTRPRMITTLRAMEPGTDGAISLGGTLVGMAASALVGLAGVLALPGGWRLGVMGAAGGVFGLLFDSLLGATLERRGWLNNDAVNFLSTLSAAAFAFGLLAVSGRVGLG